LEGQNFLRQLICLCVDSPENMRSKFYPHIIYANQSLEHNGDKRNERSLSEEQFLLHTEEDGLDWPHQKTPKGSRNLEDA